MAGGVNLNQGAESMVSFLLSLLAILESYTLVEKIEGSREILLPEVSPIEQIIRKPTSIKSILGKSGAKKSQVEESAS
jgi:hypothetical protein